MIGPRIPRTKHVPLTIDDALEEIADELSTVRDKHHPGQTSFALDSEDMPFWASYDDLDYAQEDDGSDDDEDP